VGKQGLKGASKGGYKKLETKTTSYKNNSCYAKKPKDKS
jgi:hypothetical protein